MDCSLSTRATPRTATDSTMGPLAPKPMFSTTHFTTRSVGFLSSDLWRSRYRLVCAILLGASAAPALGAELQRAAEARNSVALENLASEQALDDQRRQQDVARRAASEGLVMRRVLSDGDVIGLVGFSDGVPEYLAGTNVNAAISLSVDDIQPGGVTGLDLTGAGQTLGIWDVGRVRATHQEFNGRVVPGDNAATDNHATHVAGTMIAAGVVAPARGMAFNAAAIRSWDFFSDRSEMSAQQSVADPILVSNHSYSLISGWRFGSRGDNRWAWYGNVATNPNEDNKFGKYRFEARDLDRLTRAAPHYVVVVSAGNDRNDRGPTPGSEHWHFSGGWVLATDVHDIDGDPGGYDTLSGGLGLAKNVLTIGAVHDVPNYTSPASVSMSWFSSYGPTDDGRIKPDLVANGVSLYSPLAGSDQDYGSYNGTSMATPNTSGAIALLQQHAQSLYGADLLSSSVRGLLIHTAEETGDAPGPDYRFGWGLVNAREAAEVLSVDAAGGAGHELHELTLEHSTIQTLAIDRTDPNVPLKVTIAWTDVEGPYVGSGVDDPTPVLVNDLDVRLVSPSGVVHQPWTLNPFNRPAPAVPGDNTRDPVEQILLNNAELGVWRLEVSHKNDLRNQLPQTFSLVLSGGASQPAGTRQTLLGESGLTIASGGRLRREVVVPQGVSALQFRINGGTGNADLLVRRGSRPTNNVFDCKPSDLLSDANDTNESCVYAGPVAGGTFHIMVRARTAVSEMDLSVTIGANGEANTPPEARFSAVQQPGSLSVAFDGSGSSDAEGAITDWNWNFGDSTSGTGSTPTHGYAEPGSYEVTLTVTDEAGETSTATETVVVDAVSGSVVELLRRENMAIASRAKIRFAVTVPPGARDLRFSLSGGTGNADLYVRRDSRPTLSVYDCRPYLSHSSEECFIAGDVGGHTYHLFVRARAAVAGANLVVTYSPTSGGNQPPIAAFSVESLGEEGDRFSFSPNGSRDPDGELEGFLWAFGDGQTQSRTDASEVEHRYAGPGEYAVTLTVTDDEGAMDQATQTVEVGGASPLSLDLQWGGGGSFLLLNWSGAQGGSVFVYRNGQKIKSTGNDGSWRDNAPAQNALYVVCEKVSDLCSDGVNSGEP